MSLLWLSLLFRPEYDAKRIIFWLQLQFMSHNLCCQISLFPVNKRSPTNNECFKHSWKSHRGVARDAGVCWCASCFGEVRWHQFAKISHNMLYSSTAKGTSRSRQVSESVAFCFILQSWASSVNVVTGLQARWPRNCGSIIGKNNRFFSSPKCPD